MAVYLTRFILLLLAVINASCTQQLTPQKVAREFWVALEQGNPQGVKRHIRATDVLALGSLDEVLPIVSFELERTIIEMDIATIDTTVIINADRPLQFPLKTYLVLEDDRWKVNYEKTVNAVETAAKLATVIGKVHEFGDALQEGIDRSMGQLEATLPQIEQELSRFEEQIKQHLPELSKRLEGFSHELDKAITPAPKTERDENETEGTLAI